MREALRRACLACALGTCATGAAAARTVPPLVPPQADGRPWSASDAAALRAQLDALFAGSAAVRGAHTGLLVLETRSGVPLYARAADDEFMPASTLKLVVGSAAFARLGDDFRFHTQAFVAPQAAGNGPTLVLRTGGDPFLGEKDVGAIADAVVAAGIEALPGGVAIDRSYFDAQPYPPGWVWDDFPFYYAPVISAASFEENVLHVTATAGSAAGAPAFVATAPLAAVRPGTGPACAAQLLPVVVSQAVTGPPGTESTIDVDRSAGGCIVVVGSVPLRGSDTADAAVPSPAAYLWAALVDALRARHVDVATDVPGGPAPPLDVAPAARRSVWIHDSEPLAKVVAGMWFPSDNLVAELLLKSLGVARAGVPGTSENGAALEREWLQSIGVDPRTVTLRDGSGLSIYDRITPRALSAVLQADWNGPHREEVLGALPVAGVRGTLREEFVDTPAAGRAYVKTGSMSHVRGLAGYIETRAHGALTFALMVDDWNGEPPALDAFRGAVLRSLVGSST